jgi:hypothetical protein
VAVADGGYVAAGFSASADGDLEGAGGQGGKDALVVRYASDGSVVWKKALGTSWDEEFLSVAKVGSSFVAVGTIHGPASPGSITSGGLAGELLMGGADGLVARFDAETGELVYKKVLGSSHDDSFNAVIATKDGGYAIAGQSSRESDFAFGSLVGHAAPKGAESVFAEGLVRKHSQGDALEWQSIVNSYGNTFLSAICETDGGYLVGGSHSSGLLDSFYLPSWAADNWDAMVLRLDESGIRRDMEPDSVDVMKVIGDGYDRVKGIVGTGGAIALVGDSDSSYLWNIGKTLGS